MKNSLFFLGLSLIATAAQAQDMPADTGTFLLHKFEQHIGKETYKVQKSKDSKKYVIDFKFVDRGSPVQLKASIKIDDQFNALDFVIKGQTSRFSSIDDSVSLFDDGVTYRVDKKDTSYHISNPIRFPVAGYSPATIQMLLLQYWNSKNKPEVIKTLPFGSVQIKRAGTDELTFNGKPLPLIRYTISGLIWGDELLWTDNSGKLICILTIDAEGDKTEMMSEPYEALLPELIKRAAGYGMAAFAKATAVPASANKIVAITGGTIINVADGSTTPNGVMLLQNGIITKIAKAGTAIPKGAQIIDATGKSLMPGLWDMHSHFEQTEWGPAYLAAGVTTVRDCGNELGFIDAIQQAIDSGKGIGPKIIMAGLIDGKGPMALGIIQAATKEEAIRAVDTYKAKGFGQIKIYSSMKPAIVKVVCDEAHKQGLTVTGHIPNGMTLRAGVDSDMNMVNHIQYVYSMMKRNKDRSVNFEDSISIAAIKFIVDHKVVIDPTIGVYEMAYRNVKDDITQMEPAFYTLPLPLQTQFKTTGIEPQSAAAIKPMLTSMGQIVKRLYDAGVPIVAGTDMGFPGFSVNRELEIYVGAGLTPAQALKTATLIPAQVMGMDKQTGSIATGKNADLVIVDGNPLTNIRDTRNVQVVIKAGKVYSPTELHKMVGFSK